jgi:hypothetical protein
MADTSTATAPLEATHDRASRLPFRPLQVNRLKLIRSSESDFANLHGAVLPAGTSFEDALKPQFWGLVAQRLRIGDQIEVHVDDQTYFGRQLVRDVSGTGQTMTRASVVRLEFHRFDRVERDETALTHRVEHKGAHLKWSVIRIADGKVVRDGFETKPDAEAAMASITRVAIKTRDPAA